MLPLAARVDSVVEAAHELQIHVPMEVEVQRTHQVRKALGDEIRPLVALHHAELLAGVDHPLDRGGDELVGHLSFLWINFQLIRFLIKVILAFCYGPCCN